jgi:HK97 family phage major capsid protein
MNIAALERDLLKVSGEAASLLEKTMKECQAFEEKKDGKVVATGRPMTDDEKKAIQELVDKGNGIKATIEKAKGDANMSAEIAKLTAGMSSQQTPAAVRTSPKSFGQQFVDSEAFAWLKKSSGIRGTAWTSPSAELFAATLTEDGASGGDLIVTEYRPGILPLMFKRLVVADLLASGTTDSNSVTYMKEETFTNAAAAVAEGQPKPESTLIFNQVTDLVQKIAHWLPVTDEMLEDVAQIRSYIDARLRLGLSITEEDQLLNGSGTAPNVQGLMNRSGLTTATVRSGSVTNADAIFTAIMATFNASFVMPTGTVMNPANWQTTQLSKDGNGNYYGAGPFAGPQAPTLWGLPVAVTPSIVANTALTGAYSSAAQVFRKGGVRVEASNSHADFFVRNLTAIRAEERLALAVYRPAAFSKITSLT